MVEKELCKTPQKPKNVLNTSRSLTLGTVTSLNVSKSAFGGTFAFCNLCHCDVNINCRENAYYFSLLLDHRISLFL